MTCRIDAHRFAISECQVWRPGIYESDEAARYAEQFDDGTLVELQDSKSPGVITMEDLKRAPAKKGTTG